MNTILVAGYKSFDVGVFSTKTLADHYQKSH